MSLPPHSTIPRARSAWLGFCLALALCGFSTDSANALDSKSPEVVAMLEKAKAFIYKTPGFNTGERALCGYTLLKAGVPREDPLIQSLVGFVVNDNMLNTYRDYELCVMMMFLAKLDAVKYRSQIDTYLNALLAMQLGNGGWTYRGQQNGDTSQTQYAILALWEVEHAGIPTPDQTWINAANWYARTQDPSGGFGYSPIDPGQPNARRGQSAIRNSLCAAGTGSLYICRDHFKELPDEKEDEGKSSGLPPSFRPVEQEEKKKEKRQAPRWDGVNSKVMNDALELGNKWLEENYKIDVEEYKYYHLYALERYHSFREFVENREAEEAQWYDDGARYLMQKQDPSGSWKGDHAEIPDTCFAMLFLLRSSKTVLDEVRVALGAGQLIGGHGLPKNTAEITERAGRIRAKPLKGPAEDMLKVLEDPDNPDHDRAVEGIGEFTTEADDSTLSKHVAALRKVAAGKSPEARAAALRALARTRDLDQVPTLILALADPDERVVTEAHNGLRFISRKLASLEPEPPPRGPERRAAIKGWKAWYLAIRPNAEFEE